MSNAILLGTPLSEALVLINAVISTVIVIRLFCFKREGGRHKRWGGYLAYILIVMYAYFPIRLMFGQLVVIEWPSIVINAVVMVAMLKLKGNVMQLFKAATGQRN